MLRVSTDTDPDAVVLLVALTKPRGKLFCCVAVRIAPATKSVFSAMSLFSFRNLTS